MCLISCIQDSTCLVPYNIDLSYDTYSQGNNDDINHTFDESVRISENNIIRISQSDKIRIEQ